MTENTVNNNNEIIERVLSGVKKNPYVQEMKQFNQHGCVSTFEHCESVAKFSYKMDEMLHLNSDRNTLLMGAMLHDFYLYDWHEDDDGAHRLHGFTHANTASMNAKRYFQVDEDVSHVIDSHMWPLTLNSLPKSREAWIVCISDKCVSLYETLFRRNE